MDVISDRELAAIHFYMGAVIIAVVAVLIIEFFDWLVIRLRFIGKQLGKWKPKRGL